MAAVSIATVLARENAVKIEYTGYKMKYADDNLLAGLAQKDFQYVPCVAIKHGEVGCSCDIRFRKSKQDKTTKSTDKTTGNLHGNSKNLIQHDKQTGAVALPLPTQFPVPVVVGSVQLPPNPLLHNVPALPLQIPLQPVDGPVQPPAQPHLPYLPSPKPKTAAMGATTTNKTSNQGGFKPTKTADQTESPLIHAKEPYSSEQHIPSEATKSTTTKKKDTTGTVSSTRAMSQPPHPNPQGPSNGNKRHRS